MKIVFDVCGTLYNSNTTFDFVDFVLNKIGRKNLLKKFPIRFLLLIIYKLFGLDLYRRLYVRQLRGISISQLNILADSFVLIYLSGKKIEKVHALLDEVRKENTVVLCSASIDIVIAAIAKELRISHFFSSSLGLEDGICTGVIASDILGRKSMVISDFDWVVTDNKDDLDIIAMTKYRTIISKKKNASFWADKEIKVDFWV